MSKHTLGPWILESGQSSNVVLIDSKATNGAVGEIVDCRNFADARLIAAAPELLEALQKMLTYWNQGSFHPAVEQACAAIAKATGESK